MATDLTITAVIPLYNGSAFISEAVRSVFAQTLAPQEIIVVDDGSTDDGPAIVERLAAERPITLLRQPNSGQSAARNLAVSHAATDLIALLDQDDVWYPDHLARLIQPFVRRPACAPGWTYSDVDEIDRNGLLLSRAVLSRAVDAHPKRDVVSCLRTDMFVLPSTTLISRAAFNAVGGFDERLSGYEDDDLFMRLLRAGCDNVWIGRPLTKWRLYGNSASWSTRMARSRSIYLRKLVREFPDDGSRDLYYGRDLLAPRFLPQMAKEYKKALRSGQAGRIARAAEDLRFIDDLIPTDRRATWHGRDRSITAIISLCDGARFIEQALRSVLQQTLEPDEIIVVDDGSSNDGPGIVEQFAREYPVKLLQTQNLGQSAARNFGVAHAHGELIALLDQDDIWYPDHLEELVKPFQSTSTSELGWSYGNVDQIDTDGNFICRLYLSSLPAQHPKRDLLACLRQDMLIRASVSLISRAAFNAIGGFDEQLSGYEDDDLFTRLFRAGYTNAWTDQALTRWRLDGDHGASSRRMARSRSAYLRKLVKDFPDEPDRELYYARDLLVPRFLPQLAAEYKKALRSGRSDLIEQAAEDLRYIDKLIPPGRRADWHARAMTISAIIPLYNGEAFIEQALRSIQQQTLPPDEIIVVNDGSTDGGVAVVERLAATYAIKLLHMKNSGQSAARNFGTAHARGELIALLDQDDIWDPKHLEELVKPFRQERTSELGWSYSNIDQIDETGHVVCRLSLRSLSTQHPKTSLFACLGEDMFVLPSASLISRAAFQAVGGFDERLSGYEDDDLFMRLFHAGYENAWIEQALGRWRVYRGSASYRPRMDRSRAVYARKLALLFPDERDFKRFYCRDLLGPRFFPQMVEVYKKALRRGTGQQFREACNDMTFISGLRRPRVRWFMALLLPVMRVRWLALVLLPISVAVRPVIRWFLR